MIWDKVIELHNWYLHNQIDILQIHFKNYGILYHWAELVNPDNLDEGYYYKCQSGVNYTKLQLEQIQKTSRIKRLWEFGMTGKSNPIQKAQYKRYKRNWKKKNQILN